MFAHCERVDAVHLPECKGNRCVYPQPASIVVSFKSFVNQNWFFTRMQNSFGSISLYFKEYNMKRAAVRIRRHTVPSSHRICVYPICLASHNEASFSEMSYNNCQSLVCRSSQYHLSTAENHRQLVCNSEHQQW